MTEPDLPIWGWLVLMALLGVGAVLFAWIERRWRK